MFAFIPMPGPMELCIVGGIAVLLFGNKLPGIARSVGSSFIEFKRGLQGVEDVGKDIANDVKQASREINNGLKS